MTDQVVVVFLTIGAIGLNLMAVVRAVAMALVLESGCRWVCQTILLHRVVKLLLGFAIVCSMLVVLKSYSLYSIIFFTWGMQTEQYQILSFAFLGENYGTGILCWLFVDYVKLQSHCNTADEHKRLKVEYKKLTKPDTKYSPSNPARMGNGR